jgi:hypothetical protein
MIDNNDIDDEILNYDNTGEFEGVSDDDYIPDGIDEDFEFFDDDEQNLSDDTGEFEGVSDDDYVYEDDYEDIDFSNIKGKDFKRSFRNINKQVENKRIIKKVSVPAGRPVIVEGMKQEFVRKTPERVVTQRPAKVIRTEKRIIEKQPIIKKQVIVEKQPIIKKQVIVKKKRPVLSRDVKKSIQRPLNKKKLVKEIDVTTSARILGSNQRKIAKVIVPRDKKVIVEGVSKFILSKSQEDDAAKKIGYYKGKKLKELILIINNNTPNDFEFELFNPSMPLDYLYNTSQNLNDRISVANSPISYSDVLFNILGNPTHIVNAVFIFGGLTPALQTAQSLKFTNKEITGTQKIEPTNISLQVDTMQVFANTVNFEIEKTINRPFIPDGMDIIKYKLLAGNNVTMAFFYRQKSLKKFFIKEARDAKNLM